MTGDPCDPTTQPSPVRSTQLLIPVKRSVVEAVCRLEGVQVPQLGGNTFLEWVQLLKKMVCIVSHNSESCIFLPTSGGSWMHRPWCGETLAPGCPSMRSFLD